MLNQVPTFPDFSRIRHWVFDLDNTLYPSSCRLFAQIDVKMRAYISNLLGIDGEDAYRLQKEYYRVHGTTLSGLMKLHNIKPESFLSFVHDIDVSVIPPNPRLAEALRRLPGQKLIFTNGTVTHAKRVMARIGIEDQFDEIFDIIHADFVPKPQTETFDRFLQMHNVNPHVAVMFEDLDRNLAPAHALGMTTVLVQSEDGHADPAVRNWHATPDGPHVHHRTTDLATFLSNIRLGPAS